MPSETPTKKSRRKIIRIRRNIINNNNNNDNNNTTTATPTESQILFDQQVMGLIRDQAVRQIALADDSKFRSPEEQMQSINAGYRFLWSYGFDGLEMKRAWGELSQWRA